jgi:hypothetical protein
MAGCCLATANAADVKSHWGFPNAPDELTAYGFDFGARLFDDASSTYFVAEYHPSDGPVPPEVAVVQVFKGPSDASFLATESIRSPGGTRSRLADKESVRFNAETVPAISKVNPSMRQAMRLHHFVYARGLHFAPTGRFEYQHKYRKTPYEQPLLELVWQRPSREEPFASDYSSREGFDPSAFPVTVATAAGTRSRTAQVARTVPSATTGAEMVTTGGAGAAPVEGSSSVIRFRNWSRRYRLDRDGTLNVSIEGLGDPRSYQWQLQDDGVPRTRREARDYCHQLVLGGRSDWELPWEDDFSMLSKAAQLPAEAVDYVSRSASRRYWTGSNDNETLMGVYVELEQGRLNTRVGSMSRPKPVLCISGHQVPGTR